jgi:putative endonuclease
MQGASIYILRCSDGSYYTGITRRSVEERLSEHAQGLLGCYTEHRLPVELVFSENYERVDEAVAAERRIKGWSRAKKEAMMRGRFRGSIRARQAEENALKAGERSLVLRDAGFACSSGRGILSKLSWSDCWGSRLCLLPKPSSWEPPKAASRRTRAWGSAPAFATGLTVSRAPRSPG